MSATEKPQTPTETAQPELSFDDRFWEQYVGAKLVHDPIIAIVELVANCWDAGARAVKITWPAEGDSPLEVTDDGQGMTKAEFYRRWGGMSYDRVKYQGGTVTVQVGGITRTRKVFGRNGIGRFAGFCFAPQYEVATVKDGGRNIFMVKKGRTRPLDFDHLNTEAAECSGTTITIRSIHGSTIKPETVRTELGRRFLTDPAFQVSVNGVKIAFDDIEDKGLEKIIVPVPDLDIEVTIKVIDAQRTDPTGRQHGVAWHVLGRLVGDCGWKDPEQRSLIDGRRVEAKRFTFIVEADLLHEAGAVKPDWSGFDEENQTFGTVNKAVQEAITKRLLDVTKEKRDETTANVRRSHAHQMKRMSPIRREKWNLFVEKVAEECPSLTESELKSVSGVLANMEVANSQYGLLHKLHELSPDQIDDLHQILDDWTIDMAKLVLDEIQGRMKLIEELRIKTADDSTLEVQELQPLFRQGLWIFGPEFETIHYTSNQGMTTVIQDLMGSPATKGSLKRPDFAILPDGSVGLYSYSEFDEEGGEIGVAKLVILELKSPDVPITDKEKQQCWGYVRELYEKGMLGDRTKVQGFVLGRRIKPIDRSESTHLDGRVKILPLDFTTVLQRADSRLLKLREKIKSAPFLQDANLETFDDEALPPEGELALDTTTD